MKVEIGLGEVVSVQLTEEGKRIAAQYPGWGRKEKDGSHTYHLGSLIYVFGSHPDYTVSPFEGNKITVMTGADAIEAGWG